MTNTPNPTSLPYSPLTLDELLDRHQEHAFTACNELTFTDRHPTRSTRAKDHIRALAEARQSNAYLDAITARVNQARTDAIIARTEGEIR